MCHDPRSKKIFIDQDVIDFGTPGSIDGLKASHQCRTQGIESTQDPRLIQEPNSEEVIQTMFKLLMQTSQAG
jgi:hypothetical protein